MSTVMSTVSSNAESVFCTICYGASAEAHGEGASSPGDSGTGKSEIVTESSKCGYWSTVDDVAETC